LTWAVNKILSHYKIVQSILDNDCFSQNQLYLNYHILFKSQANYIT